MSFSTSPFGQRPPTGDSPAEPAGTTDPDVPARRSRASLDPRVLRSLLAGAAAVAVVGGGAAGLLFISSSPSGDAAVALARSGAAPTTDGAAVVRAGDVAFGTHDPFAANGVVPSTTSAGTVAAVPTTTAPRTTAPTTAPSTTVPRTPAPTSAVPTTTAPTTAAPTTTAPTTAAPTTTAPTAGPAVTFAGGTDAVATFVVAGRNVPAVKGQPVGSLPVRFEGFVPTSTPSSTPSSSAAATSGGAVGAVAVLSSTADPAVGWLVPTGAALPAAAVGPATGTVFVYGVQDDRFLVRVGQGPGTAVAVTSVVPGTPLALLGRSVPGYDRPGSDAWFSDGTVVSFGRFGGAQGDGVSF